MSTLPVPKRHDHLWKPGQSGNPGGSPKGLRRAMFNMLKELGEQATPERLRAVIVRALEDAAAGDAQARDWVSRYILGRDPDVIVNLISLDRDGETLAGMDEGFADALIESFNAVERSFRNARAIEAEVDEGPGGNGTPARAETVP